MTIGATAVTSRNAALEVATGTVVGECCARHTGTDGLRLIKRLARHYRNQELHVIVDNSSTHTTAAVMAWLERYQRVKFHFTPTGASWLNDGRGLVQHPDPQVGSPRHRSKPSGPNSWPNTFSINIRALESQPHTLRVDSGSGRYYWQGRPPEELT